MSKKLTIINVLVTIEIKKREMKEKQKDKGKSKKNQLKGMVLIKDKQRKKAVGCEESSVSSSSSEETGE
jgi:hypothetical protein